MNNVNVLYVLVSNPKDYYYEQALISAYSVRLHNPKANIILLVDNETFDLLKGRRKKLLEIVDDCIVETFSKEMKNKVKSRWLKTNMIKYLKEDFIFLDVDTIVTEKIRFEELPKENICAVIDRHGQYKVLNSQFWDYLKKIETVLSDDSFFSTGQYLQKQYFNSGVLFVKNNKSTKDFFNTWHNVWKKHSLKGLVIDQPALAKANFIHKNFIKEISGTWNCQITCGLNYLCEATILHFFATNFAFSLKPHFFMQLSTYEQVKLKGEIDSKMRENIKNAKNLFTAPLEIICQDDILIRYSYPYRLIAKLWHKNCKIYFMLHTLLHLIGRLLL